MLSPGMHRDPKYSGKFGIPSFIANTPQKTAQWWLVAAIAMLLVLPFGMYGALCGAGPLYLGLYGVLALLMLLNAWFLRNDINETTPYLVTSVISAIIGLATFGYLGSVEGFMEGRIVAGLISIGIILIMLNIIYRSWQSMLLIGVFTEQKSEPKTVGSKRPKE